MTAKRGQARVLAAMAAPALAAALALGQAACTPASVGVGAGAAVATAVQTEKGLRRAADDVRLRAEINALLFGADEKLFLAVTISVDNGRVLLTGSVETPEDRLEATRLVWRAKGVREAINEIQVRDQASLADRARDIWIANRVRAALLLDEDVRSINYSVDAVNAVVYIFGVARSQGELDRVVAHARNVEYVENVVSHAALAGRR